MVTAAALMVGIVTLLLTLTGAKPAEAALAGFPEGHGPIAFFEKDGDIWVATKMHLANLTPDTAGSTETDPAVSPDCRYVAFASDRDGDFEIYTANILTGIPVGPSTARGPPTANRSCRQKRCASSA